MSDSRPLSDQEWDAFTAIIAPLDAELQPITAQLVYRAANPSRRQRAWKSIKGFPGPDAGVGLKSFFWAMVLFFFTIIAIVVVVNLHGTPSNPGEAQNISSSVEDSSTTPVEDSPAPTSPDLSCRTSPWDQVNCSKTESWPAD